jgi:hypothetical protein
MVTGSAFADLHQPGSLFVSLPVKRVPASQIKLQYFYIENTNPLFTFIHAYATM